MQRAVRYLMILQQLLPLPFWGLYPVDYILMSVNLVVERAAVSYGVARVRCWKLTTNNSQSASFGLIERRH